MGRPKGSKDRSPRRVVTTGSGVVAPELRCTATAKQTGQRCRRAAAVGGFVCKYHGGAAGQVLDAARRRIECVLPVALERVVSLLDDPNPLYRLRAARDLMDRAGLAATRRSESRISLEQTSDLDREIADLLRRMRRGGGAEPVDAEVVDDPGDGEPPPPPAARQLPIAGRRGPVAGPAPARRDDDELDPFRGNL